MKRKVNKKNYIEGETFEGKPKKQVAKRDKSSKRRLSIYDEFDDEELDDYSSQFDDSDDDDNF